MSPHILLIIKQLGDFVKEKNINNSPSPPKKQTKTMPKFLEIQLKWDKFLKT